MWWHAQKPDFVFRGNGHVHLNRQRASVQSTTDTPGVRISVSNAGYTIFRGSVKSTGYPLHSPICPSFPLPCVTVCHHISAGVYITSKWSDRYIGSCSWHWGAEGGMEGRRTDLNCVSVWRNISWYIGLHSPVFCFRIMSLLKQVNKGPLQTPFEQF
jgi:hypothetical protein